MASTSQQIDHTVHTITSSIATPSNLQPLLDLSTATFEPAKYPDLQLACDLRFWQDCISHPHALILYTTTDTPGSATPTGFFFATPWTHPEIGREILHLFVAAVHPSARGQGIFPALMENLVKHAKGVGYAEMTVCTYPERSGTMWRILQKHGWEVVARRGERGEKVVMKINL